MYAAKSRVASALRSAGPALFLLLAIGILVRFPPDHYHFYPRCPIYTLFHLQCPGCGATRAFAALLRGNLHEAFHLNPLFTLMLPFTVFWVGNSYLQFLRHTHFSWPQVPRPAIYAALVIAGVFTVARNL